MGLKKATPSKRLKKDGTPRMHKGGPARKEIDLHVLREAAEMGCSIVDIAKLCKCSTDLLERRYMDEINSNKEDGKMKLRRMQMKLALEGNVAMCIFLGKVRLGQREDEDASKQVTAISIGIHKSRMVDEAGS